MNRTHALLAALSLAMTTGACTPGSWVELGGQRYSVEVANDDSERERGLMFRDELPAGHGMLFIHPNEQPQSYWMKNTQIPLDILYFDQSLRLVSQQRDVPPCSLGNLCPPYPSNAPARYVLELNAGEATKLDLKDGVQLQLGPDIQTAP